MTNIDDFINWWKGFRDGIDPANITEEHLNLIEGKINGLVDLWDISLPSYEEREEAIDGGLPGQFPWPIHPNYGWPYMPPIQFPNNTPHEYPRVPDIWCSGKMPHVGTPINPPHVGKLAPAPFYN